MSKSLDKLVRESRPELGVREAQDVDWAKVDRALFQRIAAEQRAASAELASRRKGSWGFVGSGLALAAAAALVVGTMHRASPGTGASLAAEEAAGNVVAVEGGGQLLVGGKPLGVGASLHAGDVVEARGAQVTLERPGKLTLVFERGSRATVTHVQGALVLSLEEGAVEAQVVPVPNGEAFAVDVGRSRIAVHGTHLRVAREGEHVSVDLSEGVVSLGDAPRIGSTLGTLVTAPAHAEFSTSDEEGTLALTHDPAGVRAPITLGSSSQSGSAHITIPPVVPPTAAKLESGDTRPAAVAAHAEGRPGAGAAVSSHAAPVVEVSPEAAITAAVRACIAERPRADNVTVVVSTTVRVTLGDDGSVSSARFDPPVAPDVNACASAAIYRARFGHGGTAAIPVDVRVPSSAP